MYMSTGNIPSPGSDEPEKIANVIGLMKKKLTIAITPTHMKKIARARSVLSKRLVTTASSAVGLRMTLTKRKQRRASTTELNEILKTSIREDRKNCHTTKQKKMMRAAMFKQ